MTTERDPDTIANTAMGPVEAETLTASTQGGILRTGYFHDGPLIERLEPDEQLQYLLSNRSKGLVIARPDEREEIKAGGKYRTGALVTDQRILFVVGREGGDWTQSLPHHSVEDSAASSGILKDKLVVTTDDAEYRMFVRKHQGVADAAAYLTQAGIKARGADETEVESESSATEQEPTEVEQLEVDVAAGDETGLPSEETVAWLSDEAVTHIEEARATLVAVEGSLERDDRIRVHNRLCFALDALDETVNTDVTERIEGVLDRIGKELDAADPVIDNERSQDTAEGTAEEGEVTRAETADDPPTDDVAGHDGDQIEMAVSVGDLPEGEVDQLIVTVLKRLSDSTDKQDVHLLTRTQAGDDVPLRIWPDHDVALEWELKATYELQNVRHEVWDTKGEQKHTFSSTPRFSAKRMSDESGSSPGPEGPNSDESEETDTDTPESGSDLVDAIMRDIDLDDEK